MRKSFLKTIATTTNTVVDGSTGELLEQDIKTIKYLANSKEEFFIIYSSLIGVIQDLQMPEVKVYCALLQRYNMGSEIALPKAMKEIIADEIGLSEGTVSNALVGLNKRKLIFSVSGKKAIYKLNPRYAFKGSTKDRDSMLRMILEVECPDC